MTHDRSDSGALVFGEHDAKTVAQMDRCMKFGSARSGVLCADGHLGYAHPIGGVIAYSDHVSISGVGFDIGCGNMAVRLDTKLDDVADRLETIVDDIARVISFGVGRKNDERVDDDVFESSLWDESDGAHELKTLARDQLGTVGSGNHYVDLFVGTDGYVWIGVHFGSRGLGHRITTHHLKLVGAKDGMEVDPALVPMNHDIGRSYINGMRLAGAYAYAGREWVVERVRRIIGGAVTFEVHNHHNYAWRERHGGVDLWVVRKGATPAFPGERGFVGGSMGDDAVILEGVDSPLSRDALYSTVHGAGRLFSRTDARGKRNKSGGWTREPMFTREQMNGWLGGRVVLRGGDVDESPMVYRRLPDVLAHHEGTIRVTHVLRPIAVLMAGANEHDPYKD